MKLGAVGLGAAALGAGCSAGRETAGAAPSAGGQPAQRLGPAPAQLLAVPPIETVRIGFVGVGGMGTVHVRNLARIEGARIQAVCDIRPEHAERARQIIVEAGHPAPTLYTRGERDFERMCGEEDLDLVYNATPWRWHVPIALAAMAHGKHTASEVPFAYRVDDCWALVEAAEKHGKHCVMMENCNYDRPEMMVLNMVRQGVLGDVLHAECGYLHDLRAIKFADEGEGLWRRDHSMTRNGNLYPTHGLGPVANCMDINRGDRLDYLVSMSSPSRGLQRWAEEHYPPGHPKRQETYVLGDVNTTLIKTAQGRTIFLSHDTNLPRPYSRIHHVQGTRGLFQGYPHRVYIEGESEPHRWDDADAWYERYDHPLWKTEARNAQGIGHGGMDYLEDYRLIHCLRHGLPTDMNVYDAAVHSAICELTERSVAEGSRPVEIPDFTRGRWKEWPRWEIDG
ncbi:MAG: Gfo/Idh/MocA family oxidoreductase [Rhodothermales bacterium]|nr:Gfo/Idh/MocA family oxidoreductase [Rhodothermales bacterium]